MSNRIFLLLVLFFSFSGLKAEDCSSSLKKAQKLFNEGQLDEAESLVSPCLKQNYYSKEDKRDAYRLLISINLYEERFREADKLMKEFLKQYPEYEVSVEDSADFIDLYKQFNTVPVYSIGARVGTNISLTKGEKKFGVNDVNRNKGKYTSDIGFDLGLTFHKNITQKLSFTTGLNYMVFQNHYEVFMYDNEIYLTYEEKQEWLQLPLDINYLFKGKRLRPYVGVGVKLGVLLTAKANINREYTATAVKSYSDVTTNKMDVQGIKKHFNLWGCGLVGARYKIPHGSVYLQMVYNYAFLNEMNTSKRYTEIPSLASEFYMVNDDVFLDHFAIQVGYYYHIYNPRKKK